MLDQNVKLYSKSQIYDKVGGNHEEVKYVMNKIISENRTIPLDFAKRKRTVRQSEAEKILDYFK